MNQGKPQTNTQKNEQLISDRAPLQHRVEKIISHKQSTITKVAEEVARNKRRKEEE